MSWFTKTRNQSETMSTPPSYESTIRNDLRAEDAQYPELHSKPSFASSLSKIWSSASHSSSSVNLPHNPSSIPPPPPPQNGSNGNAGEAKLPGNTSTTTVSSDGKEADEVVEYPHGTQLCLIVSALCLSVFLMALATAIPQITNEFHSLYHVGWYGSSYLVTTASLQLLFGKFYTYFSIKLVYLSAILVFEAGNLICALAPTSEALIAGRAISGAGGAGMFSGALVILAYTVPLAKRPLYAAGIGSVWGVSSVAGPLLGGYFSDHMTWRWCFWINLPLGAVAVLMLIFILPTPDNSHRHGKMMSWWTVLRKMDPLGNLTFIPSVLCLLVALQSGGTEHSWSSARQIFLIVSSAVLFVLFVCIQLWLQDEATLPPRVLRNRTIWASAWFTFHLGAAYVGSVYFFPIWLQACKGASALQSGYMNLPLLVMVVIVSIVAGVLVTWTAYLVPFMIFASLFMSLGYGLFLTLTPQSSAVAWVGVQLLAGTGVGLGLQLPVMAAQSVLNIQDVPTGTSIMVCLQTLGGAVSVSIAQAAFSSVFVRELEVSLIGVAARNSGNPFSSSSSPEPTDWDTSKKQILDMGATELHSNGMLDQFPELVGIYNQGLRAAFWVLVAASLASICGAVFVEWRSIRSPVSEVAPPSTSESKPESGGNEKIQSEGA